MSNRPTYTYDTSPRRVLALDLFPRLGYCPNMVYDTPARDAGLAGGVAVPEEAAAPGPVADVPVIVTGSGSRRGS